MFRDTPTAPNRSSDLKPDELKPDEGASLPSLDTYAKNDSVGPLMLAQAVAVLGTALSLGVAYSDTGEPAERFKQVSINHEPIRVLSVIDEGDQVVVEYVDQESGTPTIRSIPKENCALMPVPRGTELDMYEFERYRTTRGSILTPSRTDKLPDNIFHLKYPTDY